MKPAPPPRSFPRRNVCLLPLLLFGLGGLPADDVRGQPTLAAAVDAPQLTWTTGGPQPWVGATNVTYDGVDAAQSGPILDLDESWLQTTVVGPGGLTFWWKVSSESGKDFLQFYINGNLQVGQLSGFSGWELQSYDLPAGSHTLRWRYVKDFILNAGQDRGWVDRVTFIPSSGPATIVAQPESQIVTEGASVTFSVSAGGAGPLAYQWFKQTTAVANATNSSYHLPTVQANDAAPYSVVVSNALLAVTSSNAVLTVYLLADMLDAPQLSWTTGGARPWAGQTNVTHDGSDSVQSGPIAHSQESWLQTTVVGPGTLTYWWKVSSEINYDFLALELDGVPQGPSVSGEVDWQRRTNAIPSGAHTIRWRYYKDDSASAGQDRGWVDQVNYAAAVPLQFATLNGSLAVSNGIFHLRVLGPSGATAVVDRSPNLTAWTPWQTSAIPVGGLELSTPVATNQPQFFRARIPSP